MSFPDERREFLADGIDVQIGALATRAIANSGYAESFGGLLAGYAPVLLCHDDDVVDVVSGTTVVTAVGRSFVVVGVEPDSEIEPGFTLLRLEER